jgi:signal transduction histidine kinase
LDKQAIVENTDLSGVLVDFISVIGNARVPGELLAGATPRLREALGAARLSMASWLRQQDQLRALAEVTAAETWIWTAEQPSRTWHLDDYPLQMHVLQTGRPVTCALGGGEVGRCAGDLLRTGERGFVVIVPLHDRGRVVGLVEAVRHASGSAFTPWEVTRLAAMVNLVGEALERLRLDAAWQQRVDALETAYESLYEMHAHRRKLLEDIAHDLRTPLSFIMAYLEMMYKNEFGSVSDQQREILKIVLGKATRLVEMVGALDAAELTGDIHVSPEPVSLGRLVQDAVELGQASAVRAGVTLVAEVTDDLPLAWADPNRLYEVLENLLGNAIKFSSRGGEVVVHTQCVHDFLQVSVTDEGRGIAPEYHDKIWHRFFQVGGAQAEEGTGLGLAIVKEIIEAHGGSVWVESALDEGSAFYFTVPQAPED